MIIFFKKQSNNFKAITAMLLAVFCVTIMSVQAKLIGIEFNAVQITFARAIVVLILLMPLIYKLGGLDFLKTKKPFLHFFRGLAGLIGNVMFFLAFQRLPVADVTVISQAVPIFSCILAIIFLGETIGWRRWTAITIGFLGVIIAINPSVNIAVASLYALGGTLMWSTTIIFLRLLGSTEHPVKTKIKKVGKSIDQSFSKNYYSEIGLGIDFTARDLQEECKKNGHPWEIAKSFDQSALISENFMDLNSLSKLNFSLLKNGEIVQESNANKMIFNIDQIISYVSNYITLKTGDLIFTGTPSGVGPIKIGDNLEGFINDKSMFKVNIK